jgi:hypothetical protein
MPRRLPRNAARPASWRIALAAALTVLAGSSLLAAASTTASADARSRDYFLPGNLLVSGSVYAGRPGLLRPGVTVLPPGCTSGCVTATSDGAYPQVFNNVLADPSLGVTSPAFLAQLTPSGWSASSESRLASAGGLHDHQLLLEVRAGPEPVDQRPAGDVHGL